MEDKNFICPMIKEFQFDFYKAYKQIVRDKRLIKEIEYECSQIVLNAQLEEDSNLAIKQARKELIKETPNIWRRPWQNKKFCDIDDKEFWANVDDAINIVLANNNDLEAKQMFIDKMIEECKQFVKIAIKVKCLDFILSRTGITKMSDEDINKGSRLVKWIFP